MAVINGLSIVALSSGFVRVSGTGMVTDEDIPAIVDAIKAEYKEAKLQRIEAVKAQIALLQNQLASMKAELDVLKAS